MQTNWKDAYVTEHMRKMRVSARKVNNVFSSSLLSIRIRMSRDVNCGVREADINITHYRDLSAQDQEL